MSDELTSDQKELKSNPKVAFSEKLDDLRDSINSLYITNNASGRNKFREKWPSVALYIYGPTLVEYDNMGAPSFEARQKLEEEANLRRIELKQILTEFEDLSVESGFLKLEYIGNTIDKLGVHLASHLYAENIIERVRPGLLSPQVQTPQNLPASPVTDEKLTEAEVEILKNSPLAQSPKPLPPKGTLKALFNWICAQRSQDVKTA